MSGIESRSFEQADETRTPDRTRVEIVHLGDTEVGRFTFEPGWRWSECIKPVVGGEMCQVEHVGYVSQGTMTVTHEDGTSATITPGAVYHIAPGHDAWVDGEEPFVAFEFKNAGSYAKA